MDATHCYDGKRHRWDSIEEIGFGGTKWCRRCGSLLYWKEKQNDLYVPSMIKFLMKNLSERKVLIKGEDE